MKRLLCIILAICMLSTMAPVSAFAAEESEAEEASTMELYLSDFDWDDETLVDYTVGYGTLGLDKGISNNGDIVLGGNVYEKGIAAHASSEINLYIDYYDALMFTAVIGINNDLKAGLANFAVEIDGEEVYRADGVSGSSGAAAISVEIPENAEVLTLITEAGDTTAYDHTVWADAKIIVPKGILDVVATKRIQRAIDLIDAIGEVTEDSADAIEAARLAYDVLELLHKEQVLNLPALVAAEEAYAALGKTVEQRKTPMMGWSSWYCYKNNMTEEKLVSQMDALVELGLDKAGYVFFNVDDAYQNGRNEDGSLCVNAEKFPNGMKYIADYAHNLGLKAGIYTDAGEDTCCSRTLELERGYGVGLYNHWEEDLRMFFLDWGYDYLKVDWCGGEKLGLDKQTEYTRVGEYIDAIELEKGTDIVYNVCCWAFPGAWVADVADSWRTYGDIECNFVSVLKQIDAASVLAKYHGPGHVNDPDNLMVGRGLSYFVI